MPIDIKQLTGVLPPIIRPTDTPPKAQPQTAPFSDVIKNLVGEVDKLQKSAETATDRMLTGELEDVHQVIVAMEEAQVSFRLLMEVRNKMVEAYKEVIRMQV
ncbi:MAG: flagellar hook-basal body complex protein FliE [Calditrichaeota bacterium]|nr:flagellar hook-basal body complex protein FliE [Calditrichota bacterium]